MKTTTLLLTGITALNLWVTGNSAGERPYASGYFGLELDGVHNGLLHSIEGGDVVGEVVTFTSGGDLIAKKHIGNVKYGEFTMQLGANLAKPVYDWISDTLDGTAVRKNGAIIAADYNYRARERGEFFQALLTEITIPACDAGSKDPAYLTVKFAPEQVQWSAAKETKLSIDTRKQKTWLPSNFRLKIPGLDCSRVSKIDAFTVKQKFAEVSSGETRFETLIPGRLEFPNLRITLPAVQAETWLKWSDDFLVKGNNGDDQEKEGTLTFLAPDLSEELVRVTFLNMGVSRVHRSLSSGRSEIATITFDLYVERMQIDFMAQFEK
jgi:hypothetical protein